MVRGLNVPLVRLWGLLLQKNVDLLPINAMWAIGDNKDLMNGRM